jgi:hypothetical protein
MIPGTFFTPGEGDEDFADGSPFGSRGEFLYTGDAYVTG